MPEQERNRRFEVVRKALRYWDPIGVIEDRIAGTGLADDEYASYTVGLLRSIENGNDSYRLAHHLAGIRYNSMSLGTNQPTEREKDLAEKLVSWREQEFRGSPDFQFTRYAW